MANTWMRICRDYIDYEIKSYLSQDSGWPWIDLKKYKQQFRGGKSAGSESELVIFDMGEAKELNLFALYNVNFPAYAILGNSTSSFASPAYDSGSIEVKRNKLTGRYNSLVNPQDFGAFNYRYVGLEIPSGDPLITGVDAIDASPQHFVGSLALSDSAELLIGNTSPGLSITPSRSRQTVQMLSGAPRSVSRGQRLVEIGFTRSVLRTSEYWGQVTKYFLSLDTDNVLTLGFNGLLAEAGEDNEEYFIMCTLTEDPTYSLQNRVQADISGIRLKEVG